MTRVALLTGATGAIGRAIARGIARAPGFELVAVARDRGKGERLVHELRAQGVSARLELCDLSRKAEVRALAARWRGPLHVLVNNAAVAPRTRQVSAEGVELTLATNVLSYLWMTELFRQALASAAAESGEARVVDVASYWAGELELDDLELERRRYDNGTAYRQSKQCNRMLAVWHAERLGADRISVNACHPGDVSSALSNALGFGGSETPEAGADTPVWLATSPEVRGASGRYFEHRRETLCRFASDRAALEQLHLRCRKY